MVPGPMGFAHATCDRYPGVRPLHTLALVLAPICGGCGEIGPAR